MPISLNPAALLSGQGLDVTSLVNQMLNQKSGQITQWAREQVNLQSQASLLTSINDDLSNLADAVTALSDPLGALTAQTATSSNTGIFTATADSTSIAGNHTIIVANLATAGLVYTNVVSGGAGVPILPADTTTGDLQIQIGGPTGTVADIGIAAGTNDTLTTLASSINQQSATHNWGISASVVNDATGARLSIMSKATGTPGAVAVVGNTTTLNFNAPVGGSNASLTIDGVPYSSVSNTIAGAIPGVTLNLSNAAPNAPVQLTVNADTGQITQTINSFVAAYNRVITGINQQYEVDSTTNSEGPLGADISLRSLQSLLLNSVTHTVSGNSGLVNLGALGINMNNDGTLTGGKTSGGQTMPQVFSSNPQAFLNFFQNASVGFANAFHTQLLTLTSPTQGLLNLDLAQNKIQQQDLTDTINRFEDQLTAQQKQLTDSLSRVNASLQSYPLLLQRVTETLATMDMNGSGTGGSLHPTLTSGL